MFVFTSLNRLCFCQFMWRSLMDQYFNNLVMKTTFILFFNKWICSRLISIIMDLSYDGNSMGLTYIYIYSLIIYFCCIYKQMICDVFVNAERGFFGYWQNSRYNWHDNEIMIRMWHTFFYRGLNIIMDLCYDDGFNGQRYWTFVVYK